MVQQAIPTLIAPAGYRPQAADISVEADLLDFYLLRQRSITERVEIAAGLMTHAKELSLHFLGHQFSHLNPQQFSRKLAEAWLQNDYPTHYVPRDIPRGSDMTWIQNSAELAAQLHVVFEAADIPYFVTGGMAAIAYGDPRTTRDLDVVIRLPRAAITELQSVLEAAGFYVAGIDDVVSGRMSSLQITHIETISRADLMISNDSDYANQQFMRRRLYPFPDQSEVYLASPEDIIVSKLRWGLKSESEKQRRDVLAIFKVQQDALDYRYLYQWAAEFGLVQIIEDLVMASGVSAIAQSQLRL